MPTCTSINTRSMRAAIFIALLELTAGHIAVLRAQPPDPVLLKGHLSDVMMGAMTPDGERAATVGTDETVRLWNSKTGEEIRQYPGHTGPVYCLAISGDGRTMVTGAQDNTVRVWDLPGVRPRFQIAAHTGTASVFSLSPDGRFLVSAGNEKELRFWDTARILSQAAMNAQPALLDASTSVSRAGHLSEVQAVSFRADGVQFVTADRSGNLLLWSPFLDTPLGTIGTHAGGITSLAFHPNNTHVMSAGYDGTVRTWQLPPATQRSLETQAALRDLIAIPNQQIVIVAGDDKSLRLIDTNTGQVVREFPAQDIVSTSIAMSPNGATLLAGDEQGQVRVLNMTDGMLVAKLGGHVGAVRDIVTLPGDQQFVSAGIDGTVRQWSYPTPPVTLSGHQQNIRAIASAPSGQWFATGSDDKTVRIWNSNGQPVRGMTHPTQALQSISIRRDEQQIAAGDAGGGLNVWNVVDGAAQGTWIAHEGATTAVEYDRTQPILWSAGTDGMLKRWQLPIVPPRLSPGHSQPIPAVATSRDGRWAVTGSADQAIRVWDLLNGQVVRTLNEGQPLGSVTAVSISADGSHAAATTESGWLLVWSLADGSLKLKRTASAVAMHDVAFFPDGKRLATLSQDLTIRIWQLTEPSKEIANDAAPYQVAAMSSDGKKFAVVGTANGMPAIIVRDRESGQPLGTLVGHEAAITALAFNASANRLISGSADKTARVWNLDANGAELFKQTNHPGPVVTVAISDDGQSAFSSAGENIVHHWQVADGQEIRAIAGPTGPVRHMLVRANTLIVASDDGVVRTIDVASGNTVRNVNHGGALRLIDVTRDSARIVAVGTDRVVKCWKADDGTAHWSLPAAAQDVVGLNYSPDGSLVCAASSDGLRIHDFDGRLLERLESSPVVSQGIAWHAGGTSIVACRADGRCDLLSVSADQAMLVPDADTKHLAIAPDGKLLVASGNNPVVRIWSVSDGRISAALPIRTITGATAVVTDVAFSIDGNALAVSSEDKTVGIWDSAAIATAGGDVLAKSRFIHAAAVRSVSFSNPATRLQIATTGDDGLVSIWDLQSGKLAERSTIGVPQFAVSWGLNQSVVLGGQDNQLRTITSALLTMAPAVPTVPTDVITTLASSTGETAMIATTMLGQQAYRWKSDGSPLTPVVAATAPLKAIAVNGEGTQAIAATSSGAVWQINLADGAVTGPIALGENLSSISFTRDGREVLVGGSLPRLRAISLATGQVTEEIAIGGAPLLVQVTGAEGRQFVAAGVHPFATVQNRNSLRQWQQEKVPANVVAASPDGSRLFVGFENGTIWQIRLTDGVLERTIEAGPEAITELSVSTNGQRLYATSRDKQVRAWNSGDGKQELSILLEQPALSVAVSNDNSRIATTSADGLVHLWDAATGNPLQTFVGHQPGNLLVRWLSDNQTIVTASQDKSLRTWKLSALRSYRAHATPIYDMVLAGGGAQIITSAADGKVVSTDANSGQPTKLWAENLVEPRSLVTRRDGQRFAVGTADGTVLLWNGNGEVLQKLDASQPVVSLAFSVDGTKLAVAVKARANMPEDRAKLLMFGPLLPPQNPQPGNELILHQEVASDIPVNQVRFDQDGRNLWTSHPNGQLQSWSYAAPSFVRRFDHGGPVYCVAVSRDGSIVASGSADQTVRLWDTVLGQQRAQMSGHTGSVQALAFTPDESLVVSSSADRTIRLWDVTGGRQLKQLTTTEESIYSVAVHPNGQSLAMAGADRKIYQLNLLTGDVERTLVGHNDYIHTVAFNAQGTKLMSFGYAGNLKIWNLADGMPVFEQRLGRIGNSAAYSLDGTQVLSANGDRIARVLELPQNAR